MRKFACLAAVSLVAGLTAGGQERTTTDVTVSYSYIRAKPATRSSTDFNMQGAREFTRRASAESRSEEHTSELQSRRELVCRLLLEKKKMRGKLSPLQLECIRRGALERWA